MNLYASLMAKDPRTLTHEELDIIRDLKEINKRRQRRDAKLLEFMTAAKEKMRQDLGIHRRFLLMREIANVQKTTMDLNSDTEGDDIPRNSLTR